MLSEYINPLKNDYNSELIITFKQAKNQVCFIFFSPTVNFLFVLLARKRKVCQVSSSHLLGWQCQTGLYAIVNKLLEVRLPVIHVPFSTSERERETNSKTINRK